MQRNIEDAPAPRSTRAAEGAREAESAREADTVSAPRMHTTKNDLPPGARIAVVEILNARLCDAIDLMLQAKQAHWNVKGPGFIGLHQLFDSVHAVIAGHVDHLAERAVQLGGTADGTVRAVARCSTLGEYPLDAVEGSEHLSAMATALARFGEQARSAIDHAAHLGDAGTADLFTAMSREIDEQLWMVEAHLSER